jgi:hypothetical protein
MVYLSIGVYINHGAPPMEKANYSTRIKGQAPIDDQPLQLLVA